MAEVLASLVLFCEEFLRAQPHADAKLRRTIYDFEAFIENRLTQPSEGEFVCDGLGI